MSRKFFRKFTTEELFSEFIYSLMINRKTFMVFPDNKQILIDDEVDEWIKTHDLLDETERLIYRPLNKGYVVIHSDSITNVTTPFDAMENGYEEFIKSVNED